MKKTALFPGTFDPITLGHVDIITRALPLFDEVIVGIGHNAGKQTMFPLEKRKNWIARIFRKEEKIKVVAFEGLTVSFCKETGAGFILRGIRSVRDFEYEKAIADMNGQIAPGIESIFLISSPRFNTLASTLVRDVIRNGGDVSAFVPEIVWKDLMEQKYIQV